MTTATPAQSLRRELALLCTFATNAQIAAVVRSWAADDSPDSSTQVMLSDLFSRMCHELKAERLDVMRESVKRLGELLISLDIK